MNSFIQQLQQAFNDDFTSVSLRAIIIAAACVFIVLALYVQNKWVLAGIAAYILLP